MHVVVVADPSPEGRMICSALRSRGIEVCEVPVDAAEVTSVPSGALVVLAGDAPPFADVLAALRGGSSTSMMPVVVVGGLDAGVLDRGADAWYARPVPLDRLLRKVETYLAPPQTRLRSIAPSDKTDERRAGKPVDDVSGVSPSSAAWAPPERTMELAGEAEMPTFSGEDDIEEDELPVEARPPGDVVTGISFRDELPSIEEAAAALDPDRPVSQIAIRATPRPPAPQPAPAPPPEAPESEDLSRRLFTLFRDADRRLFPDEPELDLSFRAAAAPASALVPDDMLEEVALPVEPREEDPLDAFTYVGSVSSSLEGSPSLVEAPRFGLTPVSVQLPSVAQPPEEGARTRAPSRPPPTSRHEMSRPEVSFSGVTAEDEQPSPGASRTGTFSGAELVPSRESALPERGTLAEDELCRFLFDVARESERRRIDVDLELPSGLRIGFGIVDGSLVRLDGPVHLRVLESLLGDGRVDELPADEEGAIRSLDRRIDAGLLGRFEVDRLLRRARESIVHDVVAASGLSFTLHRSANARAPSEPPLSALGLAATVVEGARRRFDRARVERAIGLPAGSYSLAPDARDRLAELGIEPEVIELVLRGEGAPLSETFGAAPPEEGVPGLVLALVACGVLELREEARGLHAAMSRGAIRAAVEAARALAEDGTYFAILGVGPGVSPRTLRDAHETRRDALASLDLAGLEGLELDRAEALAAVDEALEVLSDASLREGYERAWSA